MAAERERHVAGGADLMVEFSSSVSSWTPSVRELTRWARAAVGPRGRGATLSVRAVGLTTSRRLNRRYRGRDYATNVLSFAGPAAAARVVVADPSLGDLVISAPVVAREARQQGKPLRAHWAHLVVHGCLHLLGFDHERSGAARRMESLERTVLARLGFADPYRLPMAGSPP